MEGGVVVGGDGVERDAQELRLDDVLRGKGGVQLRGVEGSKPIPERDVRRGGLLRLQRDDPPDALDGIERLAPKQELAAQGGPVELPGGEAHAANCSRELAARCTVWPWRKTDSGHATAPA